MMAASSSTRAAQRSHDLFSPEDDGLRSAALKLFQSSGYGSIRRLQCEVTEGVVTVHGTVPNYYLKQMAQTLINRLETIRSVTNLVEVRGTDSFPYWNFEDDDTFSEATEVDPYHSRDCL